VKIRVGFVSNSSSCSFVLFGIKVGKKLDQNLEIKIMEAFNFDWKKEADKIDESLGVDFEPDVDIDVGMEEDVHEIFNKFLSFYLEPKKKLTVIADDEDGGPKNSVYIGKRIKTSSGDGVIDGKFKLDEIKKIVDSINKAMKTKHNGEIIVGNMMC